MRIIPYPLRAACISISFSPFSFWWRPSITRKVGLTEEAKANGTTIWWARWLWFQISYNRWV